MHAPCFRNVRPPHARAQHPITSLVEKKGAEEVIAECFVVKAVHETLADLCLVGCGDDVNGKPQQRRLAMRERPAPRRFTLAWFG